MYKVVLFYVLVVSFSVALRGQEIKLFTTADFDLKHQVKTCLVHTNYGKEEYTFDAQGRLTKLLTRFSEEDYDLVSYKYADKELKEKRSESYRNNTFEPAISLAHFYTVDTVAQKTITEKIVTYDNTLLEQYAYVYDANEKIVTITRITTEGIDNTQINYEASEASHTETHTINNVLQYRKKISTTTSTDNKPLKTVLETEYLAGEAIAAMEETFGESKQLLSKREFMYNSKNDTLVPTKQTIYHYNPKGILENSEVLVGKKKIKKTYRHQFDKESEGNWVKQITLPDNTYITRKITYYDTVVTPE